MHGVTEQQAVGDLDGLQKQLKELTAFVERSVGGRVAAHEVEKGVWNRMLAIGHEALGMFFRLCGDGDEGDRVTLSDGTQVRRLKGLHRQEYTSVFGTFELFRVAYGTWEGRRIEYVPLDARLQLPESKFSYLLQDWDQSLAVDAPYTQVNATIDKILGLNQSIHSLERGNGKLAEAVSAFWDHQAIPPSEEEGPLIVCTADGKGIPIRGATKAARIEETKPAQGPKPGRKKMAVVGSVYSVDRYERTPEEVLEALFRMPGETPDDPPPSRPKPLAKQVRASLIRDALGTSLPSFDEIFGWMRLQVKLRRARTSKPVILLMDGQEALWNAGLKHLPEELRLTEILDLIHVASYLWKAAHLFYPHSSVGASRFVKERMGRLLHGEVQSVIRGLRWMGSHHGLTGKRAEVLDTVCGYFQANAHRMAYNEYLAAGYPIASGVIEGACRHVVKDRMERSGMRWVLQGAHAMLGLRCIALSGAWHDFMQFRIDQETRRLYSRLPANDPEMHLELVA